MTMRPVDGRDAPSHVPLADRRQQLIDATIRVISKDGLASATTRRIAEEAGASLASLHYCFVNKIDLIAAAWEERAQRLLEAAELGFEPQQTFREAVHAISDRIWDSLIADPGGQVAQYELMFHYIRNYPDDTGRWAFDRQVGRILRALDRVLVESGETLTMDIREFFRLTTLAMEGAILQFVSYRDAEQARTDLYRVQEAVISMALSTPQGCPAAR